NRPIAEFLDYAGPANATVTSSRLSIFTCPSDQPTAVSFNWYSGPRTATVTLHSYAVNFGNTAYGQGPLNGQPFLGAPFSLIGAPEYGTANMGIFRPDGGFRTISIPNITDGVGNTMFVSELRMGQQGDFRGLAWASLGTTFTTWL